MDVSKMNQGKLDYLTEHLRLTTNRSPDRELSIASVYLLDEKKCAIFLDKLTDIFQSPSRKITASQFSKRYAFLTIASGLYAMTMYDNGLDVSIENSHIESVNQGQVWLPSLRLDHVMITRAHIGKRDEWREEVIRRIFNGNLAKVWESISKVANIPLTILWENTAVYVYWLYENRMREMADDNENGRIQDDLDYILNAPSDLFGYKLNPFAKYYGQKDCVSSSGELVRKRKTCCYYYKIGSSPAYCNTCPIEKRKS